MKKIVFQLIFQVATAATAGETMAETHLTEIAGDAEAIAEEVVETVAAGKF